MRSNIRIKNLQVWALKEQEKFLPLLVPSSVFTPGFLSSRFLPHSHPTGRWQLFIYILSKAHILQGAYQITPALEESFLYFVIRSPNLSTRTRPCTHSKTAVN